MSGFLLRILINALMLFALAVKLPGIFIETYGSTLLSCALIGLVNAAIRPLFTRGALPLTLAVLGSFTLAVNVFMPLAVAISVPGFKISGFFAATGGALLLTACSYVCSKMIQDR